MNPAISIVVPAYNKEPYIKQCMDSLINQTLKNIEIIVVDDASTDNTLQILRDYEKKDSRVKIIAKALNGGLHMARKTAVKSTTGDYVLFVDADDEIELKACEVLYSYVSSHPADILHFGVSIHPEGKSDEDFAYSYDQMYAQTNGDQSGDNIIKSSFSSDFPHWMPWNVITALFKGDLIRASFEKTVSTRLTKVEDAYEYFVTASSANTLKDLTAFRALKYHIGRGISGRSKISVERFSTEQQYIKDVVNAFCDFAGDFVDDSNGAFVNDSFDDCALKSRKQTVEEAAKWFNNRALKIVKDEFFTRLKVEDFQEAINAVIKTWGLERACLIVLEELVHLMNQVVEDDCVIKHGSVCDVLLNVYRNIKPDSFNDSQNATYAEQVDLMSLHIMQVSKQKYEEEQKRLQIEEQKRYDAMPAYKRFAKKIKNMVKNLTKPKNDK
ncbi:glycosyltransferase family 2 protein [Gardnerella vaginalis]|uniref:glycosyltransferase family 2 protein n=1 Tax=Gardnerella vaginalis TaxID=2702 RepID=UPI000E20E482|nr:glycosyltransferase family 2 protein [Gardnerella vaginalis]RDX00025.1 glycosyl transferase [Gardnerella vaginalis]